MHPDSPNLLQPAVPFEQRTIDFYGEPLYAVRDHEGHVWVPLKRLCEAIGVSYNSQHGKVKEDPVLGRNLAPAPVTLPDGRTYQMECLSLKYVRGWLFSINANRVKAAVRERLIQYQEEVYEIIDHAFSRPLPEDGIDDAVLEALRENALQQAQLWQTVIAERRRLRAVEEWMADMDGRVTDLGHQMWQQEQLLGEALQELRDLRGQQGRILAQFSDIARLLPAPSDAIGPAEKAALKELVNEIVRTADGKGVQLGQGSNNYPPVWGALKYQFDVAKYDEISLAQYPHAVQWLKEWLHRLRDQ